MHKRSASNYSLWPEQARPRRGKGVTLAAGGFAIGIACAIAANNVISDVINPAPDQDIPRQVAVEDYKPIYATPVFAPPTIPSLPANQVSTTGAAVKLPTPTVAAPSPTLSASPAPLKPAGANEAAKPSRTAARAPSEATRPASGGYAAGPSAATDGRGGDGAIGHTTLGALNPVLGTRLTDEEEPSARDGTTRRQGASAPATTRPTVKKPPKRTREREQVKKKKRRNRRSNYAVRYRSGPVYGSRGQMVSSGSRGTGVEY